MVSPVHLIVIDGNAFHDLNGFYDEAQRKLTDDFKGFGRNLDALNDIFRGGFGRFGPGEPVTIAWKHADKSRVDLGREETMRYVVDRIAKCHPSNVPLFKKRLDELSAGKGQTLFDEIVEMARKHRHVTLQLE